MISFDDIKTVLAKYIDPYVENDFVSTKLVKNITCNENKIIIQLEFGYPISPQRREEISQELSTLLAAAFPHETFCFDIDWQIKSHQIQSGIQGLPQVKNIIAVASGKGGVGKSTTAVNIAMALSKQGATVGLLDADIYGPNQPQMLGITQVPPIKQDNRLHPVDVYGIQTMSIGYLIDPKTPMIWRGPMVTSALLQLLNETEWKELDYLIIDLPPGTGDIQLTLAQKIPVSGAIIVTTPQEVALQDARKGIEMFQKVKIPILGIVENMSVFVCSHCHHAESLFGEGGGERLANEYQLAFLGGIPLEGAIREQSDKGNPIVCAQPDSEVSKQYTRIAMKMAAKLSIQERSYAHHFPKIIIENN